LALAESVLARRKPDQPSSRPICSKGNAFFLKWEGRIHPRIRRRSPRSTRVLKSTDGHRSQRKRGGRTRREILEGMGQPDKAMGLYLDVLYDRSQSRHHRGLVGRLSWQIKAGWEAGQMREKQQDWRGAIEIYKRLEQIRRPTRAGVPRLGKQAAPRQLYLRVARRAIPRRWLTRLLLLGVMTGSSGGWSRLVMAELGAAQFPEGVPARPGGIRRGSATWRRMLRHSMSSRSTLAAMDRALSSPSIGTYFSRAANRHGLRPAGAIVIGTPSPEIRRFESAVRSFWQA